MNNNKLIAEFMGVGKLHEAQSSNQWNQYHTSWDWLMPVIEKIENDGLDPHGMIDKSLRKNKQKKWRSIEDLYNVAVYLIKIHNKSNKMDTLPTSVQ